MRIQRWKVDSQKYPHKESCNDREVALAGNFPGFWKKKPGQADIHSHDFSYRFSLACLQLWMSKLIAIAKGKEPSATTPSSNSRQTTQKKKLLSMPWARYTLIPVKFLLLENSENQSPKMHTLLLPLCWEQRHWWSSLWEQFLIKEGLGRRAVGRWQRRSCPHSYLHFNSFSKKSVQQWMHQGDDL